jgi:hypothetical protein
MGRLLSIEIVVTSTTLFAACERIAGDNANMTMTQPTMNLLMSPPSSIKLPSYGATENTTPPSS